MLIALAVAMSVAGLPCWFLARHLPLLVTHLVLAAAAALAGLLIYASGVAAGQYGSIFVWGTLIAAYFFPRRVAAAHLAWLLGVYAVVLATVESTAGYSPLTRWLFTAVSLAVVMALTSAIVARRARADLRARRFFDLSQDMLCTADMDGYFVELNSAWHQLGYSEEELRSVPFVELVHPDDRARTEAEAAGLFEGGETARLREPLPRQGRHLALAALELDPGPRRGIDLRPRQRRHRAEADRVRTREPADRGRGPRPQRRPHRTAEPARARRAAAARDGPSAPRRVGAVPGDRRPRPLQGLQRRTRPPRRRRDAAPLRPRLGLGAAGRGHDRPLRRRGVPRRPPRHAARAGSGDRRAAARGDAGCFRPAPPGSPAGMGSRRPTT